MIRKHNRPVVWVENGVVLKRWISSRACGRDLNISYMTVQNYCNDIRYKGKYKLMWELDYFKKELSKRH